LALCICNIEQKHFNTISKKEDFFTKASFIARLGSGSACRSIYGPIVLWGHLPEIKGSSDEIALSINQLVHPVFNTYHDTILVVNSGTKALSSSAGHELMNNHTYASVRYSQARENLNKLLAALANGDELMFSRIVENEALTLHGLLFSSFPYHVLIHPNTLAVILKMIEFRASTNHLFTFTLDAGPNVHLLYPERNKKVLMEFVETELKQYCEHELWIDDRLANGPKNLIEN
jgi:diphosphomevalonate decarboxylase